MLDSLPRFHNLAQRKEKENRRLATDATWSYLWRWRRYPRLWDMRKITHSETWISPVVWQACNHSWMAPAPMSCLSRACASAQGAAFCAQDKFARVSFKLPHKHPGGAESVRLAFKGVLWHILNKSGFRNCKHLSQRVWVAQGIQTGACLRCGAWTLLWVLWKHTASGSQPLTWLACTGVVTGLHPFSPVTRGRWQRELQWRTWGGQSEDKSRRGVRQPVLHSLPPAQVKLLQESQCDSNNW